MSPFLRTCFAILFMTQSAIYADNGYDKDFVDLVEIVYGDGFLSQGGSEMIERMFAGIDLKGKRVLDLGCGVGGPALHLVKNHNVTVIGIDPESFMIQECNAALKKLRKTKGSAQFLTMKDPLSLREFPNGSFDIVTSKEAILHIPVEHKEKYFQEIFRVLKKDGQLVIMDWLHSSPNYSDEVRAMMEMDGVPFNLTTPEEYRKILVQAGFSNVTLTDFTGILEEQTHQDISNIEAHQEQIVTKFGKECYDYALSSWKIQGRAFKDRELLVELIKAVKN